MEGKLKNWNEEKGFGFISSNEEPKNIFIHISALKKMSRRPVIGDIITFQIDIDNNGKKRAVSASIKGVSPVKRSATKNKKHKSSQPIKLTHLSWASLSINILWYSFVFFKMLRASFPVVNLWGRSGCRKTPYFPLI